MTLAFALATVPVLGESHAVSVAQFLTMRVKIGNFFIFLGLLILWHTLFSIFGLYKSRRLSTLAADSRDILVATSLARNLVPAGRGVDLAYSYGHPHFPGSFLGSQHTHAYLRPGHA